MMKYFLQATVVVLYLLLTTQCSFAQFHNLEEASKFLVGEFQTELIIRPNPKIDNNVIIYRSEKQVAVVIYKGGYGVPVINYTAEKEIKIVSANFKSNDVGIFLILLSNGTIVKAEWNGSQSKYDLNAPVKPTIDFSNSSKIVGDAVYVLKQGKVYASWDTAKTWKIDSTNIGNLTVTNISIDTNNYGWISTNQGVFFQHPDSTIWRKAAPLPETFQNATAIFVDHRNRIFVSRPGSVYYSIDRGSSWNDISDGSMESIVSFGDDAFGNVYAVGQGSGAYRLSNLTPPWKSIGDSIKAQAYLPSSEKIINSITGDSILFAATRYGIFQSTDFGTNWMPSPTAVQSPSHNFYTGVIKGGKYYFISNNLGIFRVATGDSLWEKIFPKKGFVWGVNAFTSDSAGNLYGNFPIKTGPSSWLFYTVKSTDHGDTWIPDTVGQKALGINAGTQSFDYFVTKQGEQYLGGSGILYSKKPGQNWKRDTAGIGLKSGEFIADVSLDNKKGIIYVGRRLGSFPTYTFALYKRGSNDTIWQVVNTSLLAVSEGRLYSDHKGDIIVRTLSGSYKIWKYDGSSWSEIPLPTDFGGAFALQLTVDRSGIIWGVFSSGSLNKGVYFTTNNGASWKYVGLNGVGIKYLHAVDDSSAGLNKSTGSSSLPGVYAVTFIDGVFRFTTATEPSSVQNNKPEAALFYTLYQNYPNPFNPTTEIRYQTPEVSRVSLKIFDILGREVATLVNEEKPAGGYTVPFNGKHLASGVYFYRLQAGEFMQTKKLLLQK